MKYLVTTFVLWLTTAAACSSWHAPAEDQRAAWKLPSPRMSPDSVVLQVVFVRATADRRAEIMDLWRQVDEQTLPSELRRRLGANGFRAGHLGQQMPAVLHRLLEERSAPVDLTSDDAQRLEEEVTFRPYHIQSRQGVRTPIVAGSDVDALHVLVNEDGVVRGESFSQARCLFGLRSTPLGDGRVRVELTPEIEYGEPHNRRVGEEGIWRLDFGRDRRTFDPLRIEAELSPGQSLALSCTDEPVGMGGSYFDKGHGDHTILLVRLAQTQKDDLFQDPATPLPSPQGKF